MLVQVGMVRAMRTESLRQWTVLAILCVAQQTWSCRAYKLGVIMKLREEFSEGYHDLRAVAKSLERRDHQVEIKSVNIPGTDWRALVTEEDLVTPKYDAILTSGLSAASLTGETPTPAGQQLFHKQHQCCHWCQIVLFLLSRQPLHLL